MDLSLSPEEASRLRRNGRWFRDGNAFVVEILGQTSIGSRPDVECANPDAPEDERLYRKRFVRSVFYGTSEYDRAVREHLAGPNAFVVAVNGYTSLTPAECAAYGVRTGDYDCACRELLRSVSAMLRAQLPEIDIRFVHGAGPGIDQTTRTFATEAGFRHLGFNCPRYLFYVDDVDQPIYVAETVDEYADAFVRSCDMLIAANGREHSYRMDIDAVLKHDKFFVPVNVLRAISSNGGPPARNKDGHIEDAVAHFEQRVYMQNRSAAVSTTADRWRSTVIDTGDIAVCIARQFLPSSAAWQVKL